MKIEIISVVPRSGSGVTVKVRLSADENSEICRFDITDEDRQSLGISVGGELTQHEYEALEAADEYCRALQKGAELLSFGANSRMTLQMKLRRRGFSEKSAVRAAASLCDCGYINESADAEAVMRSCLAKGYGKRRIVIKLREKGYDSDTVSNALEELDSVDFSAQCALLIQKKCKALPAERAELDRLTAVMTRYGYSFGEIKQAYRLLGGSAQ